MFKLASCREAHLVGCTVANPFTECMMQQSYHIKSVREQSVLSLIRPREVHVMINVSSKSHHSLNQGYHIIPCHIIQELLAPSDRTSYT